MPHLFAWYINKINFFFNITQHSTKVKICCGLDGNQINCPFFYDNNDTDQCESIYETNCLNMVVFMFQNGNLNE